MPRVTGIIDEETDAQLKAHSAQFGIAVSKLVAMGVPLALAAHKETIISHAQAITTNKVPTRSTPRNLR